MGSIAKSGIHVVADAIPPAQGSAQRRATARPCAGELSLNIRTKASGNHDVQTAHFQSVCASALVGLIENKKEEQK